MFTKAEYFTLSEADRDLVRQVASWLGYEKLDDKPDDEHEWSEYIFELIGDSYDGCVPEGYADDGDLRGSIRKKFAVVLNVVVDKVIDRLGLKPWDVDVLIDSDYDDTTRWAVCYGDRILNRGGIKPWHYHFANFAELCECLNAEINTACTRFKCLTPSVS